MKLFNKAVIVGTGLIGGSIALGLKKKALAGEVIGISRSQKTLSLAKKRKAIDKGSLDLHIAKGADLLIFATPPSTVLKLAPAIAKIISRDCIVSDASSTKEEIVRKLEKIFKRFVGAHPLAGSEKQGIKHACAGIFKGSLCILTPTPNTDQGAIKKIKSLWLSLGSRVAFLSPAKHDRALSLVSHLPHVTAFATIGTIPVDNLKFAASGLRDSTRLASSDSRLWADILLSNKKNILKDISSFGNNLARIKSAIKRNDVKSLARILQAAKHKREILG
ncbi:MAG: prephenate dehydrogenase [Candidatus Omnitrophica bacterium]|nr:prephenate dehydrogenase [Candidatus Omnitrophota bacterium]